jgi:hypothetical protein
MNATEIAAVMSRYFRIEYDRNSPVFAVSSQIKYHLGSTTCPKCSVVRGPPNCGRIVHFSWNAALRSLSHSHYSISFPESRNLNIDIPPVLQDTTFSKADMPTCCRKVSRCVIRWGILTIEDWCGSFKMGR